MSRSYVSHPPSSVLLAVTGMSPAILTETAWALAQEKPRRLPGKVVAFATTRSREQIRKELLASGVWANLRRAVRAKDDELIFGDAGDHIRVFTHRGKELEDLRTPEDNRAAADFILEHLRQFTENPDIQIVASIAGGRKTMGALLYAAMTLIGRETDRITHVLVDEALEQRRDPKFYFPDRPAEAAGIQLADLPFVPLRNGFADLGRMPGGFLSLVVRYSRQLRRDAMSKPHVRLDDARMAVRVHDVEIHLRPRAYVVLKFALELNQQNRVPSGLNVSDPEFRAFIEKTGIQPGWAKNAEVSLDLRRELSEIRKVFRQAGLTWMPGERRDALRLPPFTLD